jgi:adenosylcobinamide-GDP ribazoletransferase
MLLVAAGVLLTGGLHLDGLADWADALGASRDREVRLAVMKDPRVGSFGVIALFLMIAAKWTALERILEAGSAAYIPLALIAPRWLMAELSCKLPSARAGIGTAAPFILGATRGRRITAGGLGLGLCLPWGLIGAGFFGLAWAAGLIWSGHCRRGFGGITGDLLGACGEIVEVVLLFAICFLPTEPVLWYTIPGLW